MAPEQIRGGALDERADVYSFGCTVFELVSGRTPYTGMSSDELLMKHLRAPAPSLEALVKNVTPRVRPVGSAVVGEEAGRPAAVDG